MTAAHPQPSSDPMPDALWSLGCHDFGAESFYVIEGSARFVIGDREEVLGPGGFVRVPPSVPHSFETLGDALSRMRLET